MRTHARYVHTASFQCTTMCLASSPRSLLEKFHSYTKHSGVVLGVKEPRRCMSDAKPFALTRVPVRERAKDVSLCPFYFVSSLGFDAFKMFIEGRCSIDDQLNKLFR